MQWYENSSIIAVSYCGKIVAEFTFSVWYCDYRILITLQSYSSMNYGTKWISLTVAELKLNFRLYFITDVFLLILWTGRIILMINFSGELKFSSEKTLEICKFEIHYFTILFSFLMGTHIIYIGAKGLIGPSPAGVCFRVGMLCS